MKTVQPMDIEPLVHAARRIVGFSLPGVDRQAFRHFHSYITDPEPDFLSEWKKSKDKSWANKITNGILGDVQNGLAGVLYHSNNLVQLENDLIEALEKAQFRKLIDPYTTVSLGNSLKIDFEYQGYVLAYRRCLEYLTVAVAAYFKSQLNSYRKIGHVLERQPESSVSVLLKPVCEEFKDDFAFVVSDPNGARSKRDLIAHFQFVSAGAVNVTRDGVFIVGGEDPLSLFRRGVSFGEMTTQKTLALQAFLRRAIRAFANGMYEDEVKRLNTQ